MMEYKIMLSSDKIAITGKTVADEKLNVIRRFKDEARLRGVDPKAIHADTTKEEAEKVVSKRQHEISLMVYFYQTYANRITNIGQFMDIMKTIETIKDAIKKEFIILEGVHVERMVKCFESLQDKPPSVFELPEIMGQLNAPEKVEKPKVFSG